MSCDKQRNVDGDEDEDVLKIEDYSLRVSNNECSEELRQSLHNFLRFDRVELTK